MKYCLGLFAVLSVLVLNACSSDVPVKQELYESDEDRYAQNIVIKDRSTEHFVIEYRDVRIDEVSSIAAKHCNNSGMRAVLQETSLFKNNRMRATFVCAIL